MSNEVEFTSYQKVLVFGIKSTGKTTLTNYIQSGKFNEQLPTNDSILQFFIF
jgi:GTPase SAR1 family protein